MSTSRPPDDGEPPGDDQQPDEPLSADDEESPFPTETVEFMVPDELLAVALRGGFRVGEHRIALDVVSTFLTRLDGLVYAIAGVLYGRASGRRGPLKRIQIGGLALTEITWSSAVFHFALASDEQRELTPAGEITSATESALAAVAQLLELGVAGDEEQLHALTRDFGPRVATNFGRLLAILSDNEINSQWRVAERPAPIALTTEGALQTQVILRREGREEVEVIRVRGYLYEANAQRHKFEMLVEEGWDAERIRGTYDPEMREVIRSAWDSRVEAELRVKRYFLERQDEPYDTTFELLDVVRTLADEES